VNGLLSALHRANDSAAWCPSSSKQTYSQNIPNHTQTLFYTIPNNNGTQDKKIFPLRIFVQDWVVLALSCVSSYITVRDQSGKKDSCPNIQRFSHEDGRDRKRLEPLRQNSFWCVLHGLCCMWCKRNEAKLIFSFLIITCNVFHDLFKSQKHETRRLPTLKGLSIHSSRFGPDELSVMSSEIVFYISDCVG